MGSRFILAFTAAALLLGLLLPAAARGELGLTERAAKRKAGEWERKYGASQPTFITDAGGRVVVECWIAPLTEWSRPLAAAFAKELLPDRLAAARWKKIHTGSEMTVFALRDGTQVIFQEGLTGVSGIEVRAAGYKGAGC